MCLFLDIAVLLRLNSHTSGWTTLRGADQRRAILKESAILNEVQSRFSEHKAKGESWGFTYWTKVSKESVSRLQPLVAEGRQLTCLEHVDFDRVGANAATALRSMW